MRSLMWSVVYAMTLIGLVLSDLKADCSDLKETQAISSCVHMKWTGKALDPSSILGAFGFGSGSPGFGFGDLNPSQPKSNPAPNAQLDCCLGVDNQCILALYIKDKCERKSGYGESLKEGFKTEYKKCENSGVQWSPDVCQPLKKQISEDCKKYPKWVVMDCDPKEVEVAAGGVALVPNWMYWSITTIALIVLKYLN